MRLAPRVDASGGRGIADAALDRGGHYEEHRTGTGEDRSLKRAHVTAYRGVKGQWLITRADLVAFLAPDVGIAILGAASTGPADRPTYKLLRQEISGAIPDGRSGQRGIA